MIDVDEFKDDLDDVNLIDFDGKILGDDGVEFVLVGAAANKIATPAIFSGNDKRLISHLDP